MKLKHGRTSRNCCGMAGSAGACGNTLNPHTWRVSPSDVGLLKSLNDRSLLFVTESSGSVVSAFINYIWSWTFVFGERFIFLSSCG